MSTSRSAALRLTKKPVLVPATAGLCVLVTVTAAAPKVLAKICSCPGAPSAIAPFWLASKVTRLLIKVEEKTPVPMLARGTMLPSANPAENLTQKREPSTSWSVLCTRFWLSTTTTSSMRASSFAPRSMCRAYVARSMLAASPFLPGKAAVMWDSDEGISSMSAGVTEMIWPLRVTSVLSPWPKVTSWWLDTSF